MSPQKIEKKFFKAISRIVYDKSGINLKDGKESLVRSRVNKRLRALELSSYDEYLGYISKDENFDEIENLIDVITTNVTSFFREAGSLKYIGEKISEWLDEGRRKIKIWSAASSSGEEPYTLAIIIEEILAEKNLEGELDYRILATDISETVLIKAKNGRYSAEKVKDIPGNIKLRYFTKERTPSGDFYIVKDFIKEKIIFRQFNLMAGNYPIKGPVDIIFCRNVMIYFDTPTREKVIEKMYRLLPKNGYFVVGNAESLIGKKTEFNLEKPAVYRKIK